MGKSVQIDRYEIQRELDRIIRKEMNRDERGTPGIQEHLHLGAGVIYPMYSRQEDPITLENNSPVATTHLFNTPGTAPGAVRDGFLDGNARALNQGHYGLINTPSAGLGRGRYPGEHSRNPQQTMGRILFERNQGATGSQQEVTPPKISSERVFVTVSDYIEGKDSGSDRELENRGERATQAAPPNYQTPSVATSGQRGNIKETNVYGQRPMMSIRPIVE